MEVQELILEKLELIIGMLVTLTGRPVATVNDNFDAFTQYYFDTFRWRRVSQETKRTDLCRYNAYILPAFGDMPIHEITPEHCQNMIDGLSDKPKTAHEVFVLLNIIFKAAIKHRIIVHNPCDMVFLQSYEKQHGKALTREEETLLLTATSGTPYQLMFAVALYTGLRPNEYKSARVENGFIVAKNSKQKDGKEHKKKIPISPKLMLYIPRNGTLRFYVIERIREKFKEILPNHKLYDMRTTFYTRCQECGVSEVARKLFVGHALGGLADTYTDVSDDYLLREGQKLNY